MIRAALCAFALLVGSLPAGAVSVPVHYTCSLNWDGSCDTAFLAGDKPQPGASCTTWETCGPIGAAVGEVNEVSPTELDIAASSIADWEDVVVATKTFASGDVQVCATVPDQSAWTGYDDNWTDFGVTIQETGSAPGYWWFRAFLPNINDVPRRKFGTQTSNSAQQCTLQTGAVILCATHQESTDTFQAWQSSDGLTFNPCGDPVVRDSGSLDAGAWGTSGEPDQTSFATLTSVTATNTITVFTEDDPPAFTAGPTAGTPTADNVQISFTVDQTGNVGGVICPNGQADPTPAQLIAGNCTGDIAAVDAFTQPVVAGVADGDSFAGLSPSTTYDAHLIPSSPNGNATAISTIADIITDDDTPPTGEGTCTLAPLASPNNTPIGAGEYSTYNGPCRSGPDTVLGHDLSNPPDTPIADRSGLFDVSNSLPSNLKGKRLYHCKANWDQIERTGGVSVNDNADPDVIDPTGFDFSVIDDCITASQNAGYDGILLHMRGVVAHITNCAGTTNKFLSEWTAPDWAEALAALDEESCNTGNDFKVTNLNLANATVRNEYKEFIRAFAAQNYKTRDNFWVVMHMKSSSRGEECCGGLTSTVMNEIVDVWTSGFGANAYKLAWLRELPADAWTNAVIDGGSGYRGGIMENCQRVQYSPGEPSISGRTLDANGYMTVTPNYPPITGLRHFMEELEFHTLIERTYFICAMHAMQMRRNLMWVFEGSDMNFRIDDWMADQMGHTVAGQPEGWAWLMRSNAPPTGSPTILQNMERGVMQRDALGATLPTHKVAHGDDLTGQANFVGLTHANCNYGGNSQCDATAFSRRENNASNIIGFALEDAWWPTSLTRNAVVKISYFADAANLTVELRNSAGTVRGQFDTSGTNGSVRTATLFIDNFTAPASGENKDFDLHFPDGPVDISMVRVIKNGGSCGSNTCATWAD